MLTLTRKGPWAELAQTDIVIAAAHAPVANHPDIPLRLLMNKFSSY
jgi:hypothetical protein